MKNAKKKLVAGTLLGVMAVGAITPVGAAVHATTTVGGTPLLTAAETKGILVVKALDATTKAPLSGVVFAVIDSSTGQEVRRLTTNGSGTMGSYFLTGSYTVKQVTATTGYDVNTTSQSVQIVNGGTTTSTFYNLKKPEQKGVIVVKAQDSTTKAPIAGVVFAIIDNATGQEVRRLTTNDSGTMGTYFPTGTYTVKEVTAPIGYVVNTTTQTAQVVTNGTTTVTFPNVKIQDQKGIITVVAKDANTQAPLANVVFSIVNATTGQEVRRLTTNGSGTMGAYFPVGSYTVKEVAVPAGYNMNTAVKSINVANNGSSTVTMTNSKTVVVPQTGALTIKTVDNTGVPIAGVEYDIMNTAGTVIKTVVSDASGSLTTTLNAGTYTLKQTKIPTGYELNPAVQQVELTANGTVTFTMTNPKSVVVPKTGTVTVKAVDSSTGGALAGVEYSVVDGSGVVVSKATTDATGAAVMTVNAGSYTVKQTKVPTGYDVNTTTYPVNVVVGGGAVVTMSNSKTVVVPQTGTITVKAADTATGAALAGVEFSFIDATTGAVVQTATTDASGSATATLKTGSYTVKQSKAPTGYNLHLATYSVDLGAGTGATVTTTNSKTIVVPTTGTITMKATDMDGVAIAGMEFGVFDAAGTLVKTAVTDATGNTSVVVPTGTYTVKQTKVPAGYNENTKVQTVTVAAGGGAGITSMNSKTTVAPTTGTVTMKALDATTKAPLAGVQFSIMNSAGAVVQTVTTDATGTAVVTLAAGSYTAKETKLPTGYGVTVNTYSMNILAGGKSTFTVTYTK